jgi:hypothetical protein
MVHPYRRFEILLPLSRGDGQPDAAELIAATLLELRQRFGATSTETQTIHGATGSSFGQLERDDLIRVFVDVPATRDETSFFEQYKAVLKERFQQADIWMTTYPVEVI